MELILRDGETEYVVDMEVHEFAWKAQGTAGREITNNPTGEYQAREGWRYATAPKHPVQIGNKVYLVQCNVMLDRSDAPEFVKEHDYLFGSLGKAKGEQATRIALALERYYKPQNNVDGILEKLEKSTADETAERQANAVAAVPPADNFADNPDATNGDGATAPRKQKVAQVH